MIDIDKIKLFSRSKGHIFRDKQSEIEATIHAVNFDTGMITSREGKKEYHISNCEIIHPSMIGDKQLQMAADKLPNYVIYEKDGILKISFMIGQGYEIWYSWRFKRYVLKMIKGKEVIIINEVNNNIQELFDFILA
jgi:hypothetical protein